MIDLDPEMKKTLVRSGILGLVLAWALWQNQLLTWKVIQVSESTIGVLTEISGKLSNLDSKLPPPKVKK